MTGKTDLQYASELATEYLAVSKTLVNEWNRMTFYFPFQPNADLARVIWRAQALAQLWMDISNKLR